MRKRFMAIVLVGRLVLGLSGCGGCSSTSSMSASMTQEETENTSADAAKEAVPEEVEDIALEEYSTDDLVDMWLSGELTREDIWRKVAYGEIDYAVYEEFLECIPNSQEFDDMQSDEVPENQSIKVDTDVLSLLTEHVIEFEDFDGYRIRETIQLSPIFTEDDMETVYALWEALGNDVADFPSEESLYDKNYLLRDARDRLSCNKLEYIIGTYGIENLTDGFSITPDNPRTYSSRLAAKKVSAFNEEHDGAAASIFNDHYVIMVIYSNGVVYYDEKDAGNSGVMLGVSEMESDILRPHAFVIALPNGATPNRPDGYCYDKIQLQFGCLASPYSDSDTFELTYFE